MDKLGFPQKLVKLCKIINIDIRDKVTSGKHISSELKVKG